MGKVIFFNLMTLDGYFEGSNQDINWHNVDKEFDQFSIEQLEAAKGLIFGHTTYDLMASFWPSEGARRDDPVVAGWMNRLPKYVFSKNLKKADWQNTTLITRDASAELKKLKQQTDGDLFIFGSADLAQTFFKDGLIDEIRALLNPLLLGNGTPLFKPSQERINLKLIQVRAFNNSNVLLYYQVLT